MFVSVLNPNAIKTHMLQGTHIAYIYWLGEEEAFQINNSQCPFHITRFYIVCFSSTCHHIASRLSLLSFPVPLHQLIGSFCPWHRSESSNLCFSELLFCECWAKIDCLTFQRMFSTGIQNIPSFISTTNCSGVS